MTCEPPTSTARPVLLTAEADRARTAAAAAADRIRTINHATQHRADFQVGDVYAISADLAALDHRFRQAATQLAAVLVARLECGGLRHDTGGDVEDVVLTAHDRLTRAGDLAAHPVDSSSWIVAFRPSTSEHRSLMVDGCNSRTHRQHTRSPGWPPSATSR